jgi:hypothetical protein
VLETTSRRHVTLDSWAPIRSATARIAFSATDRSGPARASRHATTSRCYRRGIPDGNREPLREDQPQGRQRGERYRRWMRHAASQTHAATPQPAAAQ